MVGVVGSSPIAPTNLPSSCNAATPSVGTCLGTFSPRKGPPRESRLTRFAHVASQGSNAARSASRSGMALNESATRRALPSIRRYLLSRILGILLVSFLVFVGTAYLIVVRPVQEEL